MENLDPKALAEWDKTEGENERKRVILELQKRITSRHPMSLFTTKTQSKPDYGVDDNLTDQKQQDQENEMNDALAETIKLIKEYALIFARTPKSPGTTDTIEHTIETEGNLPSSPPMYRRSKPDRDLLDEWVEWMLAHGLITPSTASYAQNVLVVRKPGKEPRVCIDPRAINKITKTDPYPIPRMDEIFASLSKSKIFSTLDAASGFWQIPIAKKDRHKTAFKTHKGVFEFVVMPFGLTNAPATFTRWMDATFTGLNLFFKNYIDDLLIHSSKISDHPTHLREVFERCKRNGLKLRLSKCVFLQPQVEMLGYIVTEKGVEKDLRKIQAILTWGENRKPEESPFRNLKDLQCFLGMVNFYRHFQKFIANDLVKLSDLGKKGINIPKTWNLQHELAFQRVKAVIAEQTLLNYPQEDLPFCIYTDASDVAIGGTLLQWVTNNKGEEIPNVVEHYSRGLKNPERNYSVSEREFLAIISCVEKWKHYLHSPFTVITDHKPLLSMHTTEKPRMKRWALRLSPFTFAIKHQPGVTMAHADALSRDPKYYHMTLDQPNNKKESIFQEEKCYRIYETEEVVIYADEEITKNMTSLFPANNNLRHVHQERIQNIPKTSAPIFLGEAEEILLENDELEEEQFEILPLRETVIIKDNTIVSLKTDLPRENPFSEEPDANHPTIEQATGTDENQPGTSKTEIEPTKMEQDLLNQLFKSMGVDPEDTNPTVLYPGSRTFVQEQDADPLIAQIKKSLEKLENKQNLEYFIEKDSQLLMYKSSKGTPRVVVPSQSEDTLLYLFHDHPLAGHAKPEKMLKAISKGFYFPNMKRRVKEWVTQCRCMRSSARLRKKAGLMLSRPIAEIFQVIFMDIVGPFPPSRRQNQYWLTIICALSKDVELVPIRKADAPSVAKAIMVHWVCRRGCPRMLVSDNAKSFTGRVTQHLCQALGVKQDLITPYHHKGTGLVENIHAYAESILQTVTEQKFSLWDEQLPYIQFAIMTHAIDDTDITPFQIKYGVPPTLPGDLLVDSYKIPKDLRKYYQRVQNTIQTTRKYFQIQRRKRRIKARMTQDRLQRRYRVNYKPGDWVYVSKPSFTRVDGLVGLSKLEGKFRGPYQITKIDNHNNIFVLIDGEEHRFSVESTDKAYTNDPLKRLPPQYLQGYKYDPPAINSEEEKTDSREERNPQQQKPLHRKRKEPEENKKDFETKHEVKKQTKKQKVQNKPVSPQPTDLTGGREGKFAIVQDCALGHHYVGKILFEDGIEKVHLHKKAKGGKFHPIWFDPSDESDPPRSRSQPHKPKGWSPWLVVPYTDTTWKLLEPPKPNVKELDLKLLH